ncbi:uncharacterized protein PHALS_15448 [Plasmopara halstedii]|uniref:Uncharacterized protein n=1 Tax=Plasmopara halstedii TaxID=4781 RepID=A0A0P1AHM0_PLAHL|nr:uncharacterized protein PHALS_15448 [Plasmopara halstedii]CEG40448.1 hypothetical protein PHALS_15448 [Plasmopara halstedii]|eukprot:XP_024576817.1 hypothetical protein PHALS_15448 [Plasmopara halstedii]
MSVAFIAAIKDTTAINGYNSTLASQKHVPSSLKSLSCFANCYFKTYHELFKQKRGRRLVCTT